METTQIPAVEANDSEAVMNMQVDQHIEKNNDLQLVTNPLGSNHTSGMWVHFWAKSISDSRRLNVCNLAEEHFTGEKVSFNTTNCLKYLRLIMKKKQQRVKRIKKCGNQSTHMHVSFFSCGTESIFCLNSTFESDLRTSCGGSGSRGHSHIHVV